MTEGLDALAHSIAADAARADIASMCPRVRDDGGGLSWCDVHAATDPMERECIARARTYLAAIGALETHPRYTHLVRFKDGLQFIGVDLAGQGTDCTIFGRRLRNGHIHVDYVHQPSKGVFHSCIDIDGVLQWNDDQLMGLMASVQRCPQEHPMLARDWLRQQKAMGCKVLPIGPACEGFSYQTGCPGHPAQGESA